MLGKLGEVWEVTDELVQCLDKFTAALYGMKGINASVDEARYSCINRMCMKEGQNCNVDMTTLPPCKRSLEQHVKRTNYQVAIWKRANSPTPDIPAVHKDHGWKMGETGLQPLWFEGLSQPQKLQDVAIDNSDDDDSDSDAYVNDSESEYENDTDSDYN